MEKETITNTNYNTIYVKISPIIDSTEHSEELFTHYVKFPLNMNHTFEIKACLIGFTHIVRIWIECEYKVIFENEYPKNK